MRFVSMLLVVGLSVSLTWQSEAGGKSDSKVKATATATKPDANGKQTVTITLEIEKGWYLYANPVNFKLGGMPEDFFTGLTITVTAKKKSKVDVTYPAGTTFKEGEGRLEFQYDLYEGCVTIEAAVQRAKGDVSPLEIAVFVDATDRKMFCLLPATIKLTVPEK